MKATRIAAYEKGKVTLPTTSGVFPQELGYAGICQKVIGWEKYFIACAFDWNGAEEV